MKRKVALIGAGVMGANHARTIANSAQFELTSVIDVSLNRAEDLANRYGAMFSTQLQTALDADVSIVASSTESHFSTAEYLLSSGQPLLVEKPLTLSIGETRALCEIAVKSSIPLMCGFVERFNPAITAALKVVDGSLTHLTATRHSPHPSRATTGVVEDLLIHDLDLAVNIMESDVTVCGVAQIQPAGATFNEIAEVSLSWENSRLCHLSTSRWGQRKVRLWTLSTRTQLVEVDLLQQTVVAYENISQDVGPGGGPSFRSRTVIDYPFIERSGEPLSGQLLHFGKLLESRTESAAEIDGILKTHSAMDEILRWSA